LVKRTQPQIAKTAGFGLSTVVDIELGRRLVSAEKAQAIGIALEVAGVMFGTDGSVKLRKGKRK
jgi:transcriptional regulator with XRE-family HTH domain